MLSLHRRVTAATATLEHFKGRPFEWGKVDCVKVAAWHLRHLGHRVSGLGKAGTYRTALSARRALARAGFASVEEALQSMGLTSIAPAAALPGDLFVSAGSEGMDAVGVVAGNGAVLGFHEDDLASGLQAIRIDDITAVRAWRA